MEGRQGGKPQTHSCLSHRSRRAGFPVALGVAWFPISPAAALPAEEEFVLVLYCWARWFVLMPLCSCCSHAGDKSRTHKEQSFGCLPYCPLQISENFSVKVWKLLKRLKICLLVHALVNAQSDVVGFVSLES